MPQHDGTTGQMSGPSPWIFVRLVYHLFDLFPTQLTSTLGPSPAISALVEPAVVVLLKLS